MGDGEVSASQYDAMGSAYSSDIEESAFNAYYERPATTDLVGDVSGLRVLEVGCGPGGLTNWLVDHGAAVTAFDVSQEMVRLASSRVGGRATVVKADASEPLTFAADGSMDLVVASLVLHYMEDWTSVLSEMHRVLAPHGAVVFSTHHPTMDWQLHSPENYFAIKQITESWTKGEKTYDVTFWRRPLTAMTLAIYKAGFYIERIVEPEPESVLYELDPGADEKLRTSPRFLFFRLAKRRDGET
jgi:ubiquinone/menaquinone biosynthesis C-methylase UbiE